MISIPDDNALVPHFPEHTSVKVIGLGGVGGILARYLIVFLMSLQEPGRVVCIDGDEFEPRNAERMLFAECGLKADVLVDEFADRVEDSLVTLVPIPEYVTPENIGQLIRTGDHVLLCVDNHATRRLVSTHCATLDDVLLISGGNDGVETDPSGRQLHGTYGNCMVYLRRNRQDASPSLTKFHHEIDQPADHLPTDKSCTELLASVPQILFANLAVASAMLNAYWLYLCGALHYSELTFDILEGRMQPLPLPAPTLT